MFNNVGHVRPASPINTKGEFPHVMRPHDRVTHVGRQNCLNEPVINTAGHEGGMGHRVHKEEILVVPGGGATEKYAEGLDRADRGIGGKGRKRNRRGTAGCSLILNKKRGRRGKVIADPWSTMARREIWANSEHRLPEARAVRKRVLKSNRRGEQVRWSTCS